MRWISESLVVKASTVFRVSQQGVSSSNRHAMIAPICIFSCSVRNKPFVFKTIRLRAMKRLVSADIEAYAQAHSMPESDLCRALREETQRRMESRR